MTARVLALILALALVSIPSQFRTDVLAQQFTSPRNISNNATASINPVVAVDNAGNINVVWADAAGIFFARSTNAGASFQTRGPISGIASTNTRSPDIAVDASGSIHVVWEASVGILTEAQGVLFARSTDGGSSFSSALLLSNFLFNATTPTIATDSRSIVVAWVDRTTGRPEILSRRSTDGGANFSPAINLSAGVGIDTDAPDAAADSAGNVNVVWQTRLVTNGPQEIRFARSTNQGQSFAAARTISNTATASIEPAVAVDTSGNISVVWAETGPGILFTRSTNGGASFSPLVTAIPVVPGQTAAGQPDLAIDPVGNINVVASVAPVGTIAALPADVIFSRSTNSGASFSQPANLSFNSGNSIFPAISVEQAGHVNVVWDDNSPQNRDVFFVRGTVPPPAQPDFVVSDLSVAPSSTTAGGTVTINFTIANQGTSTAGPATHEIRLSSDNVITGGDLLLATVVDSASLPAGASRPFSRAVTIPAGTPPGQPFIGVIADSTGAVTESNETNNTVAAPITITQPLPDFAVSNLAVSPSNVAPGGTTAVSFSIVNQGAGDAGSAVHEVRLSSDPVITASDPLLATVNTSALNPGVSSPFNNLPVTIPPGTASGTMFIGVIADASNLAAESNETNNTATTQVMILQIEADLVVQNLTVSPPGAAPGSQVQVNFTILNQGGSVAGMTTHEIRFSDDALIGTTDPLLASVADSGSLAPNQTRSFTQVVTIPATAKAGTRFIGVIADRFNTVVESDETNNTATARLAVQFAVVRVFPINGALNVPQESNVEIEFSAPLVPVSVNSATVMVTTGTGAPVGGQVTAATNRAFFFPADRLPPQTVFQVRVVDGPAGVRGLVDDVPTTLSAPFTSRFTTESAAARNQPPTDGSQPVRVETGGTIMDGAGTGAAVTIPAFTLKTDTVVSIDVLSSSGMSSPFSSEFEAQSATQAQLDSVFLRVSDLVRYASQPPDAVAFGPGMDMVFPLRSPFRGGFVLGTRLRLFQLTETENGLEFLDTGIDAEVTQPGGLLFGDFAVASGVEVFGTYALFIPVDNLPSKLRPPSFKVPLKPRQWEWFLPLDPWPLVPGFELERTAASPLQAGNNTLYFPVITQTGGRATRISLTNTDPVDNVSVMFTAYSDAGVNQGTQTRLLSGGQQASFLATDLFPGLPSGAIIAQAQVGSVTGFYEIGDNFAAPEMLDGAEAVLVPPSAFVFPVIRTTSGAMTEVRVFNPNATSVEVRLAAFTSSGSRLSLITEVFTLGSQEQMVRSSSGVSAGVPSVVIPFDQLNGGYLIVESVSGEGLIGVELVEENIVVGSVAERNLAVLNAVELPSGCLPTGTGSCQLDASVPAASRQHTSYTVHLEGDPFDAEVFLVNPTDTDARIAFSAFDSATRFLGSQPRRGFLTLGAHQVMRQSVRALFGFNPGQLGGYLRIEDPDSVVVGAVVNRDGASQKSMTTLPLVPDLAQQGLDSTEAFFSRMQIDSGSPAVQTGLFIVNPNNNTVRFKIVVIDLTGVETESPTQTLVGRGAFTRARTTLGILFPGTSSGHVRIEVEADPAPGTGERLIPFVTYRSTKYLSAVPAQAPAGL
jgi:hypothetical protein